MLVTKEFTFDAAHFLTDYYGKCERVHGHTYRLQVTVEGKVQSNGLVVDFVVLKRVVKKHVLEKLDHQLLNDVLDNPSAERVVQWMWDQLKDLHVLLSEEQDDPNLGDELKKYFKKGEDARLSTAGFENALRLHELKLWETPTSFVTYQGGGFFDW
ncbi:MAG: 6-carboxytetrahydropterin synthase QueD [Candidatus Gracilibacteria bacterium]